MLAKKESCASHFMNSSYREKLIEHLFVGECLKVLWKHGHQRVEVLSAEVDGAGYDLVIEVGAVIRHIQLKSSYNGARTSRQTVNGALGIKPSGCVIWIGFDQDSLKLGPFRWFGGDAGKKLPSLGDFQKAKHTKANALGVKGERQNSFTIPKARFEPVETMEELVMKLFDNSL